MNILDIFNLHKFLIATFAYKLIHGKHPHPITDFQYFTHHYGTRQKDNNTLVLPRVHTEQGKRLIAFCESEIWNAVPENIKSKTTVRSFQIALKEKLC